MPSPEAWHAKVAWEDQPHPDPAALMAMLFGRVCDKHAANQWGFCDWCGEWV